jgi:hypothetical protein
MRLTPGCFFRRWVRFTTTGIFFSNKLIVLLNVIVSFYYFAVDTILDEDSKFDGFVTSKNLQKSRAPINVTIICSDVSLFCDSNLDSHRIGLQAFLDHVIPYFQQELICSIKIATATTSGQVALQLDESDENATLHAVSENATASLTNESKFQENFRVAIEKCARMIEWKIDDVVSGFHQSRNGSSDTSIRLSFSMIKNSSVDFISLSHSVLRDALLGHKVCLASRLRRIDLPVSGDGIHCSISLEASYQIFPFSINSLHAEILSKDLEELSTMHLTVSKRIPLSAIDASLLYGVPFVIRAGMEQDYTQFCEMKIVVRSLFRVLQAQEQAILLHGRLPACDEERMRSDLGEENDDEKHLHVGSSYQSEQYFVLMAQEIPTSTMNHADWPVTPNCGLLFRMAHFDHLLNDKAMVDSIQGQYQEVDDEHETVVQYMECIENSLSTLSLGTYNPFTNCQHHIGQDVNLFAETDDIDENIHESSVLEGKTSTVVDSSTPKEMEISNDMVEISIYDLHANDDMID